MKKPKILLRFFLCSFLLGGILFSLNAQEVPSPRQKITRIIGGENANISDYPWHVAIIEKGNRAPLYDQDIICSGVIIDKRWILTAAHCVDEGISHNDIVVVCRY